MFQLQKHLSKWLQWFLIYYFKKEREKEKKTRFWSKKKKLLKITFIWWFHGSRPSESRYTLKWPNLIHKLQPNYKHCDPKLKNGITNKYGWIILGHAFLSKKKNEQCHKSFVVVTDKIVNTMSIVWKIGITNIIVW